MRPLLPSRLVQCSTDHSCRGTQSRYHDVSRSGQAGDAVGVISRSGFRKTDKFLALSLRRSARLAEEGKCDPLHLRNELRAECYDTASDSSPLVCSERSSSVRVDLTARSATFRSRRSDCRCTRRWARSTVPRVSRRKRSSARRSLGPSGSISQPSGTDPSSAGGSSSSLVASLSLDRRHPSSKGANVANRTRSTTRARRSGTPSPNSRRTSRSSTSD